MERFLEMISILGALYVAYALSMGKWTYETPAAREKRKEELKRAGLSARFYFMNAGSLFVLTLASAGTFTFYWLYKQWQSVYRGSAQSLHGNAFWRAVTGMWSFFALGNLINRTCEYTRRETSWPAFLWGTLWLGGFVLIFSPVETGWRVAGFFLFTLAPAVYQRRINTLTKKYLPFLPRAVEIMVTLAGAACVVGAFTAWKTWLK